MKVVEQATQSPGLCLFTAELEGPFLDTERWISYTDPYGYISVSFVEEMGRAVGMVDAQEVAALKAQLAQYGQKLAELQGIADAINDREAAEAKLAELTEVPA